MSGIAEIFQATLTPTKPELLARWVPQQPWFEGTAEDLAIVTAYRFVDPDGEVGIESFILRSAGTYYHLPLTYRGSENTAAEAGLITTMDHSVLGDRWIYDASVDPVYLTELRRVIADRDTAADNHYIATDTTSSPAIEIRGGGVRSGGRDEITLLHKLTLITADTAVEQAPEGSLVGAWQDGDRRMAAVLAVVR